MWSNIHKVVGVFPGQQVNSIWDGNFLCMFKCSQYSPSYEMNHCGIGSQRPIPVWIGEVTFTKLLVSYWTGYIENMIQKFALHDRLVLSFTSG